MKIKDLPIELYTRLCDEVPNRGKHFDNYKVEFELTGHDETGAIEVRIWDYESGMAPFLMALSSDEPTYDLAKKLISKPRKDNKLMYQVIDSKYNREYYSDLIGNILDHQPGDAHVRPILDLRAKKQAKDYSDKELDLLWSEVKQFFKIILSDEQTHELGKFLNEKEMAYEDAGDMFTDLDWGKFVVDFLRENKLVKDKGEQDDWTTYIAEKRAEEYSMEEEMEDERSEEPEHDEPDEGDFVLSDTGYLGSGVAVGEVGGGFLGDFKDEDEALAFVRTHMEENNFFPNIWRESDHGNMHLINASKTADAKATWNELPVPIKMQYLEDLGVKNLDVSRTPWEDLPEITRTKLQEKLKTAPTETTSGQAIWDALPEADRKEQLKNVGVLKMETAKKEWLELPPITRTRLEEKFKTKPQKLEVGKRYEVKRPDGMKEFNLTEVKGNIATLMDDAEKKFTVPLATLESGLSKGQVREALFDGNTKEFCPNCQFPLENLNKDGAIQLRDCPRCSCSLSASVESDDMIEKQAISKEERKEIIFDIETGVEERSENGILEANEFLDITDSIAHYWDVPIDLVRELGWRVLKKYKIHIKDASKKQAADTHMRFCSSCGKRAGVHSDKAWKDKLDMCQACFKDYERNEKPRKKNEPIEEPEMEKVEASKNASEGYEDIDCPKCGSDETVFHEHVASGSWSCQACGNWVEDKDLSKKVAAGADQAAARELELYIENDRDIYKSMTEPTQKLLIKKMKKGIFDLDRSIKAWQHVVDKAAHKYMFDFGSPGAKVKDTFNTATRLQVAKALAEQFKTEADLGNYDYLIEHTPNPHWDSDKSSILNAAIADNPNLFKNPDVAKAHEDVDLTSVENEDLTIEGIIEKMYQWDESEHGVNAHIYDETKKDLESQGAKMPEDIRRIEGRKKIAGTCFCGNSPAESMQEDEYPLCEEHLKEISEAKDKLLEGWPKESSNKQALGKIKLWVAAKEDAKPIKYKEKLKDIQKSREKMTQEEKDEIWKTMGDIAKPKSKKI